MTDEIEDAVKRFEAVHLKRGPDEQRYGELEQIKNENYHLKLALDEKNMELEKLKKTMQRGVFLEDIQKFSNEAMFVAGPPSNSGSCGTDLEIVTHFSGSPYKGKRTNSKATENSVATTTASHIKAEHIFFKQNVVPFIENMIASLKLSSVFKQEGRELEEKYDKFERDFWNSSLNTYLLKDIFDDIQYFHRQTIAILNRELKFKELSQRLEYLFSIFLDPREYDLDPQEHIEYLREEITDTLIRIFHYETTPYEKECIDFNKSNRTTYFDHRISSSVSGPFSHIKKKESAKRLKCIEQGFEICANAMNQAFGDKQELRAQEDSIPSITSSTGMVSEISENAMKEKDRLKESKSSLEFIPIGYDENALNSKTPKRKIYQTKELNETTPKANDENDPLQMFFQEQASYYDNTIDRRRK
ncbi:hypothetical protein HG537_0H03620 [Torulaspora globosa]|uniref:Uncharacterized protein n=1 Tax=Torulaspora globosa TaxID=48254 RepID=A0A7H9HZN6_9SACH|nr:hypothetical protein HG537_0H03620 [Torulaspora sp. CBS 2947]